MISRMSEHDLMLSLLFRVSVVVVILICTIKMIFAEKLQNNYKNLPPGPGAFPVFGSLLHVLCRSRKGGNLFSNMRKEYGKIFGMHVGNKYVILISDFKAFKEGSSKPELLARPAEQLKVVEDLTFRSLSYVQKSGISWKQEMHFIVRQLRRHGAANKYQEIMKDNFWILVDDIDRNGGKVRDFQASLSLVIFANLMNLIFGDNVAELSKLEEMSDILRRISSLPLSELCALFLPRWATALIPAFNRAFRKAEKVLELGAAFSNLVWDCAHECERNFRPPITNSLCDAFLLELTESNGTKKNSLTDFNLGANAGFLLMAGVETTRSYLEWCILLMASRQDVQERVYREIRNVVGVHRMPKYTDHIQLPFCKAILAEVHRFKTVLPYGAIRSANDDTMIQGYFIPKGSLVLFCQGAIHKDPEYWKDPHVFEPRRFLNEDETKFVRNEHLIPFGEGKRSCPGEELSVRTAFVYIVTLLQMFQILPRDENRFHLAGKMGLLSYEPKTMDSVWFKRRWNMEAR